MTKSQLTPWSTDPEFGLKYDKKVRCKFTDKTTRRDRLSTLERNNEVIAFNVLYKFFNGTIPNKPFNSTEKVLINNKWTPMNQIDIYKCFSKNQIVCEDSETSMTLCQDDISDENDLLSIDEEDITNIIEYPMKSIHPTSYTYDTYDTDEEDDDFKDELFIDNLENMISDMKNNLQSQSDYLDSLLDEKKNIESKVEISDSDENYDSDEIDEDNPYGFYREIVIDKYGNKDFLYFDKFKNDMTFSMNYDFIQWKQNNFHTFNFDND